MGDLLALDRADSHRARVLALGAESTGWAIGWPSCVASAAGSRPA